MIIDSNPPVALGAHLDVNGCNFAIHAPSAKSLLLALYDNAGDVVTVPLEKDNEGVHSTYVFGIGEGQRYGYLVEIEDKTWYVSDPYAKALESALYYLPPFSAEKSHSLPKCLVTSDQFDWQGDRPLFRQKEHTVLFETHVKGVTQLHPDIDPCHRGRYLGLISPAMLDFYRHQNITALQLLPIAACMPEPHLLEQDKTNYWGYNPYCFMAPDPRYAESNAVYELKTAIKVLHQHGIEVILDVVYNHTAESGEKGQIFNLKALDSHYYLVHGHTHCNYTGCGNTLDLRHQPTLNLVMDTLRHWVSEYHVDGFRFDLAATLGREDTQFNPGAPLFKAVAQDPVLKGIKLIAEPWDIGPNGYQVGQFPVGWNECNDKLRDTMRSFWRGDEGLLTEFATRLMGSRDYYSAAHWPQKLTVNYITYHDGFTMHDLVSYSQKHNDANGENNRDGHGDNRSNNYGVEGPSDDEAIIETRYRQKRNFMASLLFSFGIPHILMADVLSHSQNGNNNAYCQDNEISWLNWHLDANNIDFQQWLADVVSLRNQYMTRMIKAFSGPSRNANRIEWLRVDNEPLQHEDWAKHKAIMLQLGESSDGLELLYCINQSVAPARFILPLDRRQSWCILCDTQHSDTMIPVLEDELLIAPRSMAILFYDPNPSELGRRS